MQYNQFNYVRFKDSLDISSCVLLAIYCNIKAERKITALTTFDMCFGNFHVYREIFPATFIPFLAFRADTTVQHHFSIGTDVKWGLGFGEGHRSALWHDSALDGVLGGGCGGLTWDSCKLASPFISRRDTFFSTGGSPRWFLFVGFRATSCCDAVGGALSTDWRLVARCKERRSGFFGGAGRVFVSWQLYAADASEFSDTRDWESCK